MKNRKLLIFGLSLVVFISINYFNFMLNETTVTQYKELYGEEYFKQSILFGSIFNAILIILLVSLIYYLLVKFFVPAKLSFFSSMTIITFSLVCRLIFSLVAVLILKGTLQLPIIIIGLILFIFILFNLTPRYLTDIKDPLLSKKRVTYICIGLFVVLLLA